MDKFLAHILIVDDDDRIRILVKQYLQDNNYLVTTAKDAFDAKNKIDLIKFDLIVLDIMMPKKSGLELTDELKKENRIGLRNTYAWWTFGLFVWNMLDAYVDAQLSTFPVRLLESNNDIDSLKVKLN
jgi:CheY-like chemotaxis protein